MITPQHLERIRTLACDQEDGWGSPHVINEELFRRILIRERKRADRSNQPFVLLLVDMNDGLGADSSLIWETVIEALTVAKREMDIVGWFERRAVIGLILPEIHASDLANTREGLDARVRRELVNRLGAEAADKISVRLHVYLEPMRAGEAGLWRVNPLLYPERHSRWERRTIYDAIKRGLDVIGSLTLLVALSPLFLLIAALVRLRSRGPVFFGQVRIGQMMKPFTMFKFRTMCRDADPKLHHEFVSSFIKASGQIHEPGQNGFFKLANDPRVTPVGRILRKTSLDELPQLWNVLRGEMSLVGPRPPLLYELEQYKPWHRRRILEAKPGITGLWQVAGRSRTTFDEMVRLDLQYARTRSLWTDIKILLATPAAVISGKGAC
jgi:lipopolysaccharide/colanic/teichoic acid biosynthesis glycosyltransferase